MGNWKLHIEGIGPGMNSHNRNDVDHLASKFLRKLVDAGHQSVKASCVMNNQEQKVTIAPSDEEVEALENRKQSGRVPW